MDNGGIWPGDESYFQEIRETSLQDQVEQLTKELAEARAEIERKNALIEQMREALRKATNFVGLARARDELSSSHWVYDECIAALSAAERVE